MYKIQRTSPKEDVYILHNARRLLVMCSGVVAGGDKEVCQDTQLVLSQLELVFSPVVLVSSFEVLEHSLDGGGYGLGVVEVLGEDHEDVGEVGRDVVGAGLDEGTETQHTRMSPQHSFGLAALKSTKILVPSRLLPQLLGHFGLELVHEHLSGVL